MEKVKYFILVAFFSLTFASALAETERSACPLLDGLAAEIHKEEGRLFLSLTYTDGEPIYKDFVEVIPLENEGWVVVQDDDFNKESTPEGLRAHADKYYSGKTKGLRMEMSAFLEPGITFHITPDGQESQKTYYLWCYGDIWEEVFEE